MGSKSERNYGIDLLRILSMYMICVLHVNGQGHAMLRISGYEGSYYAAWFLETAGYCAVDIYGLISGYVGIDSKRKPERILELWLTAFFYSALGTLIAVYGFHLPMEEDSLWKAVFPAGWKTWWYFTAYVGVFVLMPYFNRMVDALTDMQRRRFIAVCILVFSVFYSFSKNTKTGADVFSFVGGYSFAWLSILYCIGACMRRLEVSAEVQSAAGRRVQRRVRIGRKLTIYLSLTVFSWAFKLVVENYTRKVYGEALYGRFFTGYCSPTMLISAICLLRAFSSIRLKSSVSREIIRFLSPLTFSVYIIQTQPFVWNYVMKDRFRFIATLPAPMAFVWILLGGVMVFMSCSALDLVRFGLFRLIGVRRHLTALAERFPRVREVFM